jgi:fatty acid CoA ligase FadD36
MGEVGGPGEDSGPGAGPLLGGFAGRSAAAVRCADGAMSHAELASAAAAVAERLAETARIGGGDGAAAGPVAVLARPTLVTALAVVAGLVAGVPVVPVPEDAGPDEIGHLLRDSGATAWLGQAPVAPGIDLPVLPVDPAARSSSPAPAEPDPATTALVLYTSGTTGSPKGVVISRRALAAGLDALADAWDWTSGDTLAHGLPLFHVHGLVLGVLGPLRVGSSLVHTGRPTPAAYAAAGATMYFGVPTVWHRVAGDVDAARALSGARLLVSGSAPLPVTVFDRLRDLTGHEVAERYGMTETLITVAARADRPRMAGSVGWPVRGIRTRLRDEHGEPVAEDGESVGRLQVRGPTLFDGYLGRPAETAATWTADRWFVTGDVATIGPDGRHRIVGRESVDLIKTGGFRVGAGEVEAALLTDPSIAEAAVVGVADDDLGQRIVAYVVAAQDRVVDPDALIATVAERLSVHKRPREVRVVEALPRNAMGKVVKTGLA